MADETTERTETNAGAPTTSEQGDPAALADAGKRALDAERRRASAAERQLKQMQAQVEALKAEKMSEEEKVQARLATAEIKAAEAEARAIRADIAVEHKLTPEATSKVLGHITDPDAMREAAEYLGGLLATANESSTTLKPDRYQGGAGLHDGNPPALNSNALDQALRAAVGAR